MKNVYLFNPENDLALACGELHYTPPKRPLQMAQDLASLPRWYAQEGEKTEWITLDQLQKEASFKGYRLVPWGWNSSLIQQARGAGFEEGFLPSEEQMVCLRKLSNRATAVEILKILRRELTGPLCGKSRSCRTLQEVEEFHSSCRATILKAPWSCNGRGIMSITYDRMTPQTARWAEGVIRSQGSVVAEELQQKICDFAMEFYADGTGAVSFAGYSRFETDSRGGYVGNILTTDEKIVQSLTRWIPRDLLHTVRNSLEQLLSKLLAPTGYRGYLGIDMLVAHFDSGVAFRLLPCVEMNLRMNMGMVALRLSAHFIRNRPDYQGIFKIDYFDEPQALQRDHQENLKRFPPRVQNGLPLEGYFNLTPILANTQYRAGVWVQKSIG